MDNFSKLSLENQLEVLNDPENFVGLGKSTNASKGATSWANWPGHSQMGAIPPSGQQFVNDMIQKETTLRQKLQDKINQLLLSQ
jgi:hypothetical protein